MMNLSDFQNSMAWAIMDEYTRARVVEIFALGGIVNVFRKVSGEWIEQVAEYHVSEIDWELYLNDDGGIKDTYDFGIHEDTPEQRVAMALEAEIKAIDAREKLAMQQTGGV
tara:strand:- start:371 stop:703 length:333 start_codon:yes stop_codon:yes gene_type:complete